MKKQSPPVVRAELMFHDDSFPAVFCGRLEVRSAQRGTDLDNPSSLIRRLFEEESAVGNYAYLYRDGKAVPAIPFFGRLDGPLIVSHLLLRPACFFRTAHALRRRNFHRVLVEKRNVAHFRHVDAHRPIRFEECGMKPDWRRSIGAKE